MNEDNFYGKLKSFNNYYLPKPDTDSAMISKKSLDDTIKENKKEVERIMKIFLG